MVELYPGLFVEDAKPRMDPGSGFAAPYTVGRAVLSDAVTLVRGDRFYTLVRGFSSKPAPVLRLTIQIRTIRAPP